MKIHSISTSCNDSVRIIDAGYICAHLFSSKIGEGSNGIAFLVKKINTKENYVLKVSEVSLLNDVLQKLDYLDILTENKYIIKRYLKEIQYGKMYEILEYGAKGSLETYVKNFNYKQHQRHLLSIFSMIIEGIMYMHDKNIIHADIKPQNIIVNDNDEPKIIDFDLSTLKDKVNSGRGTPAYMAPEIIANLFIEPLKFTDKQDIWSLGITLYAMLYGTSPFELDITIRQLVTLTTEKMCFNEILNFINRGQLLLKEELVLK